VERISARKHTFTIEDVTVVRMLASPAGAELISGETHHG
jgi:hypothetical protein